MKTKIQQTFQIMLLCFTVISLSLFLINNLTVFSTLAKDKINRSNNASLQFNPDIRIHLMIWDPSSPNDDKYGEGMDATTPKVLANLLPGEVRTFPVKLVNRGNVEAFLKYRFDSEKLFDLGTDADYLTTRITDTTANVTTPWYTFTQIRNAFTGLILPLPALQPSAFSENEHEYLVEVRLDPASPQTLVNLNIDDFSHQITGFNSLVPDYEIHFSDAFLTTGVFTPNEGPAATPTIIPTPTPQIIDQQSLELISLCSPEDNLREWQVIKHEDFPVPFTWETAKIGNFPVSTGSFNRWRGNTYTFDTDLFTHPGAHTVTITWGENNQFTSTLVSVPNRCKDETVK